MAEKDRVRTEQFRFTLLPEENAMLTKNAFEYGLSKSEYLRKLILAESLSGKQWHMDRDQAKQLIYEVNRIGNNVNQIAYNTNVVRFSSNKDWGELQTKYFELMTLFCQFALRENGEEKLWYKKILELISKAGLIILNRILRNGYRRSLETHCFLTQNLLKYLILVWICQKTNHFSRKLKMSNAFTAISAFYLTLKLLMSVCGQVCVLDLSGTM